MKAKIFSTLICSFVLWAFTGDTQNLDAQANDVVVIVHPSVSINKAFAQQIFKGQRKEFPSGVPAKVLLNSDSEINEAFCRDYLGISAASLDNAWITINIREGTPVPRKVPSSVANSLVSTSAVFIGIVKRSEADAKVKIIEN